ALRYGHGPSLLHSALAFDLTATALFAPLLRGEAVELAPLGEGIEPLLGAGEGGPFAFVKLTPAHLRALAAAGAPLPRTRTLVVGGEALLPGDVAPALAAGFRVVNESGPTETTVGCTAHELSGDDAVAPDDGPLPIGRPLGNTRAYVLDAHLRLLPWGAIGELCIAGGGVAAYLEPEPAAPRFVDDPFVAGARMFRTGDRARWSPDGVLEFHGRLDAQLQVRGVRVEPAEVEAALAVLPGVRAAAVAAVPAPGGGVQLGAWVVLADGADATGLPALLAERLPAAMLPRFMAPLPTLPLTPHGKVDRRALRPPPSPCSTQVAADADAPTSALCGLFAATLQAPAGADDDFFALGGDSILALQLVARARRQGLALHVRDVFTHRTA